jgi:hypothetical protein
MGQWQAGHPTPHQWVVIAMSCSCNKTVFLVTNTLPHGTEIHRSSRYKKNGSVHHGKQHHHCHDCGHQCVPCFAPYRIAEEQRGLIERLLVERMSLRGLWRAGGVPLTWLSGFLGPCCEALLDHLHGQPVACQQHVMSQRLAMEADALARCVQQTAHKP